VGHESDARRCFSNWNVQQSGLNARAKHAEDGERYASESGGGGAHAHEEDFGLENDAKRFCAEGFATAEQSVADCEMRSEEGYERESGAKQALLENRVQSDGVASGERKEDEKDLETALRRWQYFVTENETAVLGGTNAEESERRPKETVDVRMRPCVAAAEMEILFFAWMVQAAKSGATI